MSLLEHASAELDYVGIYSDTENGTKFRSLVMALMKTLNKQDVEGIEVSDAVEVFKVLATGGLLTPLNGTDDEWETVETEIVVNETGEKEEVPRLLKNKRSERVYKDAKSGKAWDNEAMKYTDSDGNVFKSKKTKRFINNFPYTPKTRYVKLEMTTEAG